MSLVAVSFLASLLLFVVIGMLSMRKKTASVEDYLVASHSVGPWLTALSSVVTNNSGYMFIGLIGYTYAQGLSAIWLMAGWIAGDWVAWHTVHPRLRRVSELQPANTIPAFLANRGGRVERRVARAAGLVTLVFLTSYAAAQLTAGSKALHVMFDWPEAAGAVAGAGIILLYSFAGGIRASIWTDAAQAVVMLGAMLALVVICMLRLGSPVALLSLLAAEDPSLVRLVPADLEFGFLAFVLGWIAAGLGVVGQPHILIRIMALRSTELIRKTRRIYFTWYVPFAFATVAVGLYARILLPETSAFDPELALPELAQRFLPSLLVGFVLAGLFAATISTADSQLLACSAAISQDLVPGMGQSYWKAKIATAVVTLAVLAVAVTSGTTVFALVIISWSGLAAGLGPLMLGRLYWGSLPPGRSVAVIASGVATVIVWRFILGWGDDVYEILPGMISGIAVYGAMRLLPGARAPRALRHAERRPLLTPTE